MVGWNRLLLAASSLALLSSCRSAGSGAGPASVPPRTTESVAAAVSATDAAADSYRRRSGRWALGDRQSTFAGLFEGPNLRLIVEEMVEGGARGSATIRYYYDNQGLYFVRESRRIKKIDGPGETTIDITLSLDAFGALIGSSRTVDGKPARLLGDELPRTLAHAGEIRSIIDPGR